MATALDPTLTKKTFNNWLKGALALLCAREGLIEFVKAEISDFQRDLLKSIFTNNRIPHGTTCSSCTTAKLCRNPNQKCPKYICHNIKNAIHKHHQFSRPRFQGPTWQITDATRWCSDAFQIAKCYLPLKGYADKSSFDEIDFIGILSVIINNTRFQNQMPAQINNCSKVREMINKIIRHSSSYEMSDKELARCIDALRDLLQDPKHLLHDQHAQDAVNKLNQLQSNTLVITLGDITKALEEDFSKRLSEHQRKAIESLLEHLAKVKEASVAILGEIIEAGDTAIKAIKQETEQQIKNVKQSVTETDDILLKNFKEDLIKTYRRNESMIPVAPLVEEHKVELEKLYVLPPMWVYDNPNHLGPGKETQNKQQTSAHDGKKRQKITFSEIFLSEDKVRYRDIYITANAGFGKTSLSQKLTMTWCQSHLPLTSFREKYEDTELDAMRHFDFLFLIHLRDYQSYPKCSIDDLVMEMVSKYTSRKSKYTNEFIERTLHEKNCLVILDGLDEWAHPGHCSRKPEVPHNNHPDSCTVLTTTRDWKIGTIGLSPNHIDRRVEMTILDDETCNLLQKNALGILNERNLNLAGKTFEDFNKEVNRVQIRDIIYIPYILLQLMCLFFDGIPIGKSKCEIFSKITEFTLERGLKKKDLSDIHAQSNDNKPVPKCMKENETCKRYIFLLLKLGKVAFYTLCSEKRESSLIFDRTIVAQFMSEQEIEFCLKVGLLCQTKDSRVISVKRYHVSFQHKSVQEFFSAFYITSEWQNQSVNLTILNVCSSLSGILEMSNVFVFVCGINPDVYTCISGELEKIVELDDVTHRYRAYIVNHICYDHDYFDTRRTMLSYQSMQVQCLQESVRNGNENCSIHLHDYILKENDLTNLKLILHINKGKVKSLQLSHSDKITVFIQSLDPGLFTSLEILRVEKVEKQDEEPVWMADILTESDRTLKCLTLSEPLFYPFSLSNISIKALTGLTCLQSLYLGWVQMTHSNLQCLYAYISQTITLTQLKLDWIYCSDHDAQYCDCDVTLDLHRLNKLKMLHLFPVPCSELHVNPACLEKLKFRPQGEITARASATLWKDLRAAPVLSSLTLHMLASCQEMIQTIPTLTQLKYIKLEMIDVGNAMPFSPAMKHLECVTLSSVIMSSAAWKELFFCVGQLPWCITVILSWIKMTSHEWRELLLGVGGVLHPVTVKLSYCAGPSEEEWQAIVNVIKTTPTLSLLLDLSIDFCGASLALKNKNV